MKKYSTKQAAGAQEIETLGDDYALKWDDETQMSVNAHAALLRLVSAICAEISDDWETSDYRYMATIKVYEHGANLQKEHLHCPHEIQRYE